MAELIQISGGPATAKLRSPVVVGVLSFVTFGIYNLPWWYSINREMADLGEARGVAKLAIEPVWSVLAIAAVYIAMFGGAILMSIGGTNAMADSTLETAFMIWFAVLAIGIVALLVTTITTFQRVKIAQRVTAVAESRLANGFLFAIAWVVFTPVGYGYLQQELNKVWRSDAGITTAPGPTFQPPAATPAQPTSE